MKKEERTKKIYRIVGEQKEFTTKELLECEFNKYDLACLVKDDILTRNEGKRGIYTFTDIEGLFSYGRDLSVHKNYPESEFILKNCLKFDSNHAGAAFYLFLQAVRIHNYELAFQYFDIFYQKEDSPYKQDYNLYLYLLSFIYPIPDKYKDLAFSIKFPNIKVQPDDERFPNQIYENRVRWAIFNHDFLQAKKMIYGKKKKYAIDYITTNLINEAIKKDKVNKGLKWHEIKESIALRNYDKLVYYFQYKARFSTLSHNESLWLTLSQAYMTINDSKTIPFVKAPKSINFYTALENQDYEQALKLYEKYLTKNGIDKETDITYLILTDIIKLIKSIKRANLIRVPNVADLQKEVTFDTIYNLLLSNDVDAALQALHVFLERNNLARFESFMVSLIKLSVKEKDFTFIRPMQNLVLLTNGYEFDITRYKEYFYEALKADIEEASLYLRIILNLKEEQNIDINVEPLKKAYSIASKR